MAHALSSVVLVFDHEALRERITCDPEGDAADRALERTLNEEIDGYLLVARQEEGWDAVLALVLALDRRHRSLLVRLLDRCVALASDHVDSLDSLTEVLSAAESLAEAIVTMSQFVVTGALTVTDTLYGSCTNYATIVLGPARARLLVSVKEHLFSLYGARSFDTIVDIDGDTANLEDRTYARNEAPLRAGLDVYDESAVFAALAGGLLRS